jgi:hypothetical protein
VAQTWGMHQLKAGDQILLTEMEHHSNLVPWQLVAERTGAELVYLPVTGDEGIAGPGAVGPLADGSGAVIERGAHLELDGDGQPGGGVVSSGAAGRCDDAGGRGPERRALRGGCAGDRLRFSGLFRTQDLRTHRGGGLVWPARVARASAAVPGWRGDDSVRWLSADDLQARARIGSKPGHRTYRAPSGCTRRWITWMRSAGSTSSSTTRNWRDTRTKGLRDARRPVVRAEAGAGGVGEFSIGGRACARRGDGGGSVWGRAAGRASLHATA